GLSAVLGSGPLAPRRYDTVARRKDRQAAGNPSMLIVETRTNPGPRTTNEDSVLWDPDLALMVIADGMGGHNAGEVASRVAIDAAQEFLRKTVKEPDATFAYG